MKRTVVAGNWKMNKTLQEAKEFILELTSNKLPNNDIEVELYVPTIYLAILNTYVKDTKIKLGAQNIYQELSGAFTGETSISMLKSIGIEKTLIGHSERREYFNETDKIVNQKVLLCLENDIKPVICIGETLDQREANITNNVLKTQVTEALKNVLEEDIKNIIIAYEPIWAIGTGVTATAEDANEACKYVRSIIKSLYNEEIAQNIVIQYGGSVKPENVKEILSQEDINGALVGGASLNVDSYLELIK